MRRTGRFTRASAITVAVALISVLTACSSGSDDSTSSTAGAPVSGGTLKWALALDPRSVSPWGGGQGDGQVYVTRQIFDTLTEQDPSTGDVLPFLAESWTVNPTATEYQFTLQPDVTFSNGEALTAEVVKNNFTAIVDAGGAANRVASVFADYAGTTVTGPLTFTVGFTKPNGFFPRELANVGLVAPSTLQVPYEDWASGEGVYGSGPFVLDSYNTGRSVILNRREGYGWAPPNMENRGDAYLDGIEFQITPEAGVRNGVLTSGQVDATDTIAPQDMDRLANAGFEIITHTNPGTPFGLGAIESDALAGEPAVREAIAYAIDRTAVRDAVLNDAFPVATSVLSNTTPGYADQSALIAHDPAKAKEILDDAGWVAGSDGVRAKDGQALIINLGWADNYAFNRNALQLIQVQLDEVGIGVELLTGSGAGFYADMASGRFGFVWGQFSGASPAVLQKSFSQSNDYFQLRNDDLESKLAAMYASSDLAEQNALAGEIQSLMVENHYFIGVFDLTSVLAVAKNVHGVGFAADARLAQLTDAWISKQG